MWSADRSSAALRKGRGLPSPKKDAKRFVRSAGGTVKSAGALLMST
jgi:hypothetical protein